MLPGNLSTPVPAVTPEPGAPEHRGHGPRLADVPALADLDGQRAARHLHGDDRIGQTQPVRHRGCGTAAAAGSQRVAGAALPDLDPQRRTVDHPGELYVGALRKQ